MEKLKVIGGGATTPVEAGEVAQLLELDNRIDELKGLRDALAANLLRRVAAQGGHLWSGPHRLRVKRSRDDARRAQELLVDGKRRYSVRSKAG